MQALGIDVLFKGINMQRLLGGLWISLRISLIAVAFSIVLGLVVGVLMAGDNPVIKAVTRVYLEIVRVMPQMVLLFIVFFGTTRVFGWNIEAEIASIIVFTFWGTAIIPQTLRRLIPLSINLVTRMIKTTSLAMMIGVVEVLKVGQQIIEANRKSSPNAAFGVYACVFVLYFAACWPISMFSKYLERKWS